jgi:hypothetical protein
MVAMEEREKKIGEKEARCWIGEKEKDTKRQSALWRIGRRRMEKNWFFCKGFCKGDFVLHWRTWFNWKNRLWHFYFRDLWTMKNRGLMCKWEPSCLCWLLIKWWTFCMFSFSSTLWWTSNLGGKNIGVRKERRKLWEGAYLKFLLTRFIFVNIQLVNKGRSCNRALWD